MCVCIYIYYLYIYILKTQLSFFDWFCIFLKLNTYIKIKVHKENIQIVVI